MDLFCPGACTSDKTLYVLQVWNLCACGTQIMRAAGCKPFQTGNQHSVSRLRACKKYFLTRSKAGASSEAPALIYREPLNKSPTADDGSFPPILRFEKREIHTVFHRFSNLVLTKNLSPSTAADLIRTSLRALRAFRLAFTRKRF